MEHNKPAALQTVLIVEDEPLLLIMAVDMIEGAGFETVTAINTDDAITILMERDDIRVVFTDIRMPGSMDGLKLVAAVRDRWPPIEIIVTSGFVNVLEADLPSRSRFFKKPYDQRRVVAALHRMAA